jgi:hypothetical protein
VHDHSLKEIRTHGPLPTIPFQTLDTLICRLLTRIKVLAVRLSKRMQSVASRYVSKRWPYVSNLVAAGPDHSSALSSLFEGGLLAIVERCDGGAMRVCDLEVCGWLDSKFAGCADVVLSITPCMRGIRRHAQRDGSAWRRAQTMWDVKVRLRDHTQGSSSQIWPR